MNRRLIGVFAFALAVASVTSFIVYRLILSHAQAPVFTSASSPANTLLVAGRDLQVGALIRDADVQEIAWPGAVPKDAIKLRTDIVGRGVTSPIFEKEPFPEQRLAPKGAGAGLASTIPVGKRAVALRVNDVVGLAGFVLPGMHVDVLIAGNVPGEGNQNGTRCRTVLQNIQVLSTGQHLEKNLEGKPDPVEEVNLLVTPDQAEVLNLASTETKVQLVLRNPLDTKEETTHGTSLASLFGQKEIFAQAAPRQPIRTAVIAAAPAPPPTVEVFSGTSRAQQVIDIPREKR
jgi:pilus assembly protein CpaB